MKEDMILQQSINKKQREQKRKLSVLIKNIAGLKADPFISDPYEHFHVPCFSNFLCHRKTKSWIKRKFCQAWLEKTNELIHNKPLNKAFCRVVCCIDYPHLTQSQIILFYNEAYYSSFWNRSSGEQIWLPIENASLKCKLLLNSAMNEKGYTEKIITDEATEQTQLWFYGELPG